MRVDNMEDPLYVLSSAGDMSGGISSRPKANGWLDTEIDWTSYMQQVTLFLSGERDYTKIRGDTGPLVYPAGHVYIFSSLHKLTLNGTDIHLAQCIFAALYIITLRGVMKCYAYAQVPPYVFPMLVLSKRLHSIFLLRCFNDAFATFFMWAAIYAYQRRSYTVGSLLFSFGIAIKMSLLLALPAFGAILYLAGGIKLGLTNAALMAQLQLLLAIPFLRENWRGYMGKAFEFSRVFMHKWTVNWRFIPESTFLSKQFCCSLLAGHATILAIFLLTRWLRPALNLRPLTSQLAKAIRFRQPLAGVQPAVAAHATPRFVMTTVLSSLAIGILFARSLHYQFFAYLGWATPYLLWRSGMHPVLMYALWAAQEWAWNVYPSTDVSSGVVVGVLAITVLAVWVGTGQPEADVPVPRVDEEVRGKLAKELDSTPSPAVVAVDK